MDNIIVSEGTQGNYISTKLFITKVFIVHVMNGIPMPFTYSYPRKHSAVISYSRKPRSMLTVPIVGLNITVGINVFSFCLIAQARTLLFAIFILLYSCPKSKVKVIVQHLAFVVLVMVRVAQMLQT